MEAVVILTIFKQNQKLFPLFDLPVGLNFDKIFEIEF